MELWKGTKVAQCGASGSAFLRFAVAGVRVSLRVFLKAPEEYRGKEHSIQLSPQTLRASWPQSLNNDLVPVQHVSLHNDQCCQILITSHRSLRPYLPDIYPEWQAIGHSRIEQRCQSIRNRLGWGTRQPGRLSGEQYRSRCYCRLAREK